MTKFFRSFSVLLLTTAFSFSAQAGPMLDIGGTFSSDALKNGSEITGSQNFYNLTAMFNLDSKAHWNLGWAVFGISQSTEASSVTTSYSSFDMGPALRWNIDKNGMFNLTLIYGYLAKGSYTQGATQELEGSSFLVQFGMQAPIREDKLYIGVTLNSYTGTYTKKVIDNVKSDSDATKSSMFPMVSLTWRL